MAPAPATGAPWVVSGDHSLVHSVSVQAVLPPFCVSLVYMYTEISSPFARIGPYWSERVAFTVVSPVTGTLAEEVPEAAGVVAACVLPAAGASVAAGDGVTAS